MNTSEIQKIEKPMAVFVLSMLAGLWMLAAGGMMGGYGWGGMMGGGGWGGMMSGRGWGGMMGGWPGMHSWMWGQGTRGLGAWWPWLGVLAGVIVLVGAVALYMKPEQRRSWGIVILVASGVFLFTGIGNLIAGTLGIIGGILAVSTKD